MCDVRERNRETRFIVGREKEENEGRSIEAGNFEKLNHDTERILKLLLKRQDIC